ncbi:MAG TPA: tRNA (pseudouridine(54)-N(1))-methyltransferase TrmY, partial [Methanomicrobiales archaeon]|nr:tRNA (pseudouridine(54)-N(1))-methyltransferase TrmY [Methanomicrobiales archaeon]
GGLHALLESCSFAVLDEEGEDIRLQDTLPSAYLLSDHQNFTPEEREEVQGLPRYSVGPRSLHADHTITVVLNELDRREC